MMGCLDEERCVGYDLDYNGPVSTLCWFHYNKADFMSENLRSREKTYLYRLVDRCPSTATTGTLNYLLTSLECLFLAVLMHTVLSLLVIR